MGARRGGTLDLSLVCGHPALHDTFEYVVLRADSAATTVEDEVPARRPQPSAATGIYRLAAPDHPV